MEHYERSPNIHVSPLRNEGVGRAAFPDSMTQIASSKYWKAGVFGTMAMTTTTETLQFTLTHHKWANSSKYQWLQYFKLAADQFFEQMQSLEWRYW